MRASRQKYIVGGGLLAASLSSYPARFMPDINMTITTAMAMAII